LTRFTREVPEPTKQWIEWWKAAHPFFWLLWALLVPTVAAVAAAPSRAPGYALESAWLYRLEVGGAFYVGLLLLSLIFWLGYSGRSVGKVQLPGGGGMALANPDPDLDDAAEGLAGYKQKTDRRLEKLENSLDELASGDEPK
jgi:hypothetical protein